MKLRIETFSNIKGGNAFYKAITHPVAARQMAALMRKIGGRRLALYDPWGLAAGAAEFYDFAAFNLIGVFVQDVNAIGTRLVGRAAAPVTGIRSSEAEAVLVAAFDAERPIEHIRRLVPPHAEILSFDAARLPNDMLSNRHVYLDPLNFATNFVFFRDTPRYRTRLTTANYWTRYGASAVEFYFALFAGWGELLAEWREPVSPAGGIIVVDSAEIRARFGLDEFTGQLFVHAVGARGHDVVKYALDIYGVGEDASLSCTHDANSWPAELYAGLPAPRQGERVILWVQNSHPRPIPPGSIGLNLMGSAAISWHDREIGPFASTPIDVSVLLPTAHWPQQIEVQAGKHMVRPRYEAIAEDRRRIAHVNVERNDLTSEPELADLEQLLGKGYLLPAPILPRTRWRTLVLPTPMATCQTELSLGMIIYDHRGNEVARHRFGKLARRDSVALDLDTILDRVTLPDSFGHLELVYDFATGTLADGWLHALFRYEDRRTGHAAETSFGSHIFNTVLTRKGEPQSYAGRPPGLSARLFLRLGGTNDTFCHLIYPASTPWRETSETALILHRADGTEVAREHVRIPCSGSHFWRYREVFDPAIQTRAGENAYIVIRDTHCRLFGYHGLIGHDGAFSLDHMFGF